MSDDPKVIHGPTGRQAQILERTIMILEKIQESGGTVTPYVQKRIDAVIKAYVTHIAKATSGR